MTLNIHTDQVGSLIRPAALLDARDDYKAGKISRDQLRAVEDASILECLKIQKEAGVEIYGDGEFRRDSWNTPVSEAVDGFVDDYPVSYVDLPDGRKERIVWHAKAVKAKLVARRRIAKTDADFLREHAPGPFKITLPSPLTLRRCYEKA